MENQLDKKMKRLRTNRGGEDESNPFNYFCEDHGIIHETTPSYSLESNGVAKRKNRTLKEIMNAMLAMLRIVRHIGFLLLSQKTVL